MQWGRMSTWGRSCKAVCPCSGSCCLCPDSTILVPETALLSAGSRAQTLADSPGIATTSVSTSLPSSQCLGDVVSWRRAAPVTVPGALQELSGEQDAASSCCCVWTAYTGHVGWQCCVYVLWDKGSVKQWIKQGGLAKPCWILVLISTTEQPCGFACGCSTFCFPSSPGLRALLSICFHMAVRSSLTCSAGRREKATCEHGGWKPAQQASVSHEQQSVPWAHRSLGRDGTANLWEPASSCRQKSLLLCYFIN